MPPNFLQVDEARSACAPFFKERRMKFREPTKPHRKSGVWGTRLWSSGEREKTHFDGASPRLYQPTYAGANMGHPFRVDVSGIVDCQGTFLIPRPGLFLHTIEVQTEVGVRTGAVDFE